MRPRCLRAHWPGPGPDPGARRGQSSGGGGGPRRFAPRPRPAPPARGAASRPARLSVAQRGSGGAPRCRWAAFLSARCLRAGQPPARLARGSCPRSAALRPARSRALKSTPQSLHHRHKGQRCRPSASACGRGFPAAAA